MAGITLIGFPLLAWPLLWFQDLSWQEILKLEKSNVSSLFMMLSIGLFFGMMMIVLTELPYFEKSLLHIRNRLMNIKLSTFFVVFLSVAAGFGEEVFFRGALQPLIGILGTSFVFVLIHGYFSLKNVVLNVFGILLFGFIVFISWMAKEYSLWHAIAAHFSYDLVLLFYYKKMQQTES
ncbi:MAG: CPBP family intramembrane glutamic endopeptidase [Crocinitomicaceae bacterium]